MPGRLASRPPPPGSARCWGGGGKPGASKPFADVLATHLDHGRRRATRMRHELDRLLVALADRAIEVLVLKGTHTGQRYFPEPGTRPTTDIDLLIEPHDLPAARQALRA